LTLETSMKIKFEVELDTEKQRDMELVDDIIYQLQDVRDLLEDYQENLNKQQTKKTNTRRK
jgi:hypothetical protein